MYIALDPWALDAGVYLLTLAVADLVADATVVKKAGFYTLE